MLASATTTATHSQHENTRYKIVNNELISSRPHSSAASPNIFSSNTTATTTSTIVSNKKSKWFPALDVVDAEVNEHLHNILDKEDFKAISSHVGLRTFVIRASPTPKLDSLFIQPTPVDLAVTLASESTFFSSLTSKQKHETLEDRSVVWLERMAKAGDRKRKSGSTPAGPLVVVHPKHIKKHAPLHLDSLAKASRGQFVLLNWQRGIRAPPYCHLTQPSAIWDELLADSGATVISAETFWLNLELFKTHPDSPSPILATPVMHVASAAPPRVLAKDGSGRIAFTLPLIGTLREFGLLSVGDWLSVGSDDTDPGMLSKNAFSRLDSTAAVSVCILKNTTPQHTAVIILPNDTLLGVCSGVVFEGIPNWFLTRVKQSGHVISAARCKQILVFYMHADVLGHPSFVAPTLWGLCEAYRHLKKTANVPPKPLTRVFRRNLVRRVLSQAPSHQVTVQTLCFTPAFARGLALMQYKEVAKRMQASANISKGTTKGLQTRTDSSHNSNNSSVHSHATEEKNDQEEEEDDEDNISIAAAADVDVDDFLGHGEDDIVHHYHQSTSLPASPSFVPAGPSTLPTPLQPALSPPPLSSSPPPPAKRTRKHRVQLWPPRKHQQEDDDEEEALSVSDSVLSDSESSTNAIEIRQQSRKRKSLDHIGEAADTVATAPTTSPQNSSHGVLQSPAPKRRKYRRAKDIVPVTPSL